MIIEAYNQTCERTLLIALLLLVKHLNNYVCREKGIITLDDYLYYYKVFK